jgi:hypothetical protein
LIQTNVSTNVDFKTGSFGQQLHSPSSQFYSYSSTGSPVGNKKYHPETRISHKVTNNGHFSKQHLVSKKTLHVRTPTSNNQFVKAGLVHHQPRRDIQGQGASVSSNNPMVHKELIMNLQEEVNFLTKSNKRLKSALMNTSGFGLMTTFQKTALRSLDSLKHHGVSQTVAY